jgi:hypothetical protein
VSCVESVSVTTDNEGFCTHQGLVSLTSVPVGKVSVTHVESVSITTDNEGFCTHQGLVSLTSAPVGKVSVTHVVSVSVTISTDKVRVRDVTCVDTISVCVSNYMYRQVEGQGCHVCRHKKCLCQ